MIVTNPLPPRLDPYLELNYRPLLPANLDARILDVGCGEGRVIAFLADLGYRSIVGVDRDADALAKLDPRPGVTLRRMDISAADLAQDADRYDLIVMREMIYYFPRRDMPEVMSAVAAILNPGGAVIIEAFNGALLCAGFTAAKDPGILTCYTEHSLKRLLQGAGLEVRHVLGPKHPRKSLRSLPYHAARRVWTTLLRMIYVLERGIDSELPKLYTKSVIAVAVNRSPARERSTELEGSARRGDPFTSPQKCERGSSGRRGCSTRYPHLLSVSAH